MRYFFALLLLSWNFYGFGQQRKIIDVHFHTRSAGDYGPLPPPNPVTGKRPDAATNEAILNTNYGLLRQNHVVKAICSGTLKRNADFIVRDPERFISSLEFPDHQNNPLPDTFTFRKLIVDKKILVFGELGLQYEGRTLDESEYEPYLAICERYGIPVAVHTGIGPPETPYRGSPKFSIDAGRPSHLEPVLKKYPKLKLQMMHAGYPYLEETKAILTVYPQVYADISVINWVLPKAEFHVYLKALLTAGFGKRLMYGSDQMIWEDAIPLSIKNIESATFLSGRQKEDLFYNNAARFFCIK
ncbi:amidohydrolase [Mucilaginibacter conchicola]|uniref:Amidohydrolase n=1 Tax=Mucilaginibacter conchicola TaxID=2303333 RepID=A0A372NQX5_9SPHI|nr:amidohydrolase family protein [Mucilaginibacter conchicola]RFZ91342.1 amidohydrolase [Mucilaginibacter conchicola]